MKHVIKRDSGFTLVELSIVIVVIGLIIAGVTAGQGLVKQARLRGLVTQSEQIRSAVSAFKLQYSGVPGDIINASSFWATGCSSSGAGGTVASDCNGNGNRQINTSNPGVKSNPASSRELYMAWMHLYKAGLFPAGGFVPGVGNMTNGSVGAINANIPPAKYTPAGISLAYHGGSISSSLTSITRNIIVFGAVGATLANTAFLTPRQANSVDTKIDDGNAKAGNVYGGVTNNLGLDNCANPTTGVYVLTTATSTCSLGIGL